MSKIKSNRLEPRATNGSLTIGNPESLTAFEGDVKIPGYATEEWVSNIVAGEIDIDLLAYQTRDEKDVAEGYAGLDETGRVPADKLDTDKIKEDVVVLQGEVESLINLYEKGEWAFDANNPPSSGKAHLSSANFTASSITATIHKDDLDGDRHTFVTASVGSWIELVEDDSDYCLGQITAITPDQPADLFQVVFNVSVGKGQAEPDGKLRIRLFDAVDEFDPNSIRIVKIGAVPPVEPKDGDLWYDNSEDTMQLRVYHHDSGAWIAAAPPSTLSGRVATGEALQAEISAAVTNLQTDKINKTGDTMRGTYTATGGNHLKFSAKDANDKGKTFVDIVNTDGNGTDGVDYKMHLYHVATPTAPYHAANQKYVDDAVGLGTSGILSEDDVKNLIDEAVPSATQHAANLQPPGVKFTYQIGSSGLSAGKFQLWENGSDKRIRISSKGADIDWLDQSITTDYTMDNGPYFTIYYMPAIVSPNDRVKWRQRRHGRVNRIDWHDNDILLYITSWHSQGELAEDASYFITIGGIL